MDKKRVLARLALTALACAALWTAAAASEAEPLPDETAAVPAEETVTEAAPETVTAADPVIPEAPKKTMEVSVTPGGLILLTPGADAVAVTVSFAFPKEDPFSKTAVPVRDIELVWEDTARSPYAASASARWTSIGSDLRIWQGDQVSVTFKFKVSKWVEPGTAVHPIRVTCSADGYAPLSTTLYFEVAAL